jgi:hypothetical protein
MMMNKSKYTLVLIWLITLSVNCFCQVNSIPNKTTKKPILIDAEAAFKGGISAWNKYVEKNFIQKLDSTCTEFANSKVSASFFVEKDGKLTNINILNPDIKRNKIEVAYQKLLENCPSWIPAIKNNNYVRSKVIKSITICLTEE